MGRTAEKIGSVNGSTAFHKRTYTLSRLGTDLVALRRRRGAVARAWDPDRVDPLLREQMMFAVAMVNDCKFCAYMHDAAAISEGADREVLAHLVGLDSATATDDRLIAILWAQGRAEAGLGPAAEWLETELRARYSAEQIGDLDTIVRYMTLLNLSGNTAEALVRRLRGRAVPGNALVDELVIGGAYLLGATSQALGASIQRGVSPQRVLREFLDFDGHAVRTMP